MSYVTYCPNGHMYIAADVYKNWPADKPKCPCCRAGAAPVRAKQPDYKMPRELERHLMT